jgi:hypothetical protein
MNTGGGRTATPVASQDSRGNKYKICFRTVKRDYPCYLSVGYTLPPDLDYSEWNPEILSLIYNLFKFLGVNYLKDLGPRRFSHSVKRHLLKNHITTEEIEQVNLAVCLSVGCRVLRV